MKMTQTPYSSRLYTFIAGLWRAIQWPAILAAAGMLWASECARASATPTVIGTEANVPIPTSAYWSAIVNIRPGNNDMVTVNPPLFSWFYAPGNPLNQAVDMNVYLYRFQADYTGTFTSPVVDVSTPSCCYNFLPPFTQSPVYWRVAYITTNGVTNSWITNMFYIGAGATNWDRSMLANPSYLASKSAHPHLLFNSANKAAFAQFMQTNNPYWWQSYVTNMAYQGLTSAYWTNPAPWGNNENILTPGIGARALEVSSAALMWQLTGNGYWTNGLAMNFDNLVNCFVACGLTGNADGFDTDYGNSGNDNNWIKGIACAYDWLYPILTPSEITNAQAALDRVIRFNLYNGFWVCPANRNISLYPNGKADTNSVYPPPYIVPWAFSQKLGGGHAWFIESATWIAALACYGDNYTNAAWPVFLTNYSSDAAMLLDHGLNFFLGRGVPDGLSCVDDARGYGIDDALSFYLPDLMQASIVFPKPISQGIQTWRPTPIGGCGICPRATNPSTINGATWARLRRV